MRLRCGLGHVDHSHRFAGGSHYLARPGAGATPTAGRGVLDGRQLHRLQGRGLGRHERGPAAIARVSGRPPKRLPPHVRGQLARLPQVHLRGQLRLFGRRQHEPQVGVRAREEGAVEGRCSRQLWQERVGAELGGACAAWGAPQVVGQDVLRIPARGRFGLHAPDSL
ncbi:hypothetical protein FGB62_84g010 [Gracilaria domingensis]|nr:hypothetical protein FGB62_84g010 [Gracilaria domingensis]